LHILPGAPQKSRIIGSQLHDKENVEHEAQFGFNKSLGFEPEPKL